MTITSALIAELRRDSGDEPKSTSVQRAGNGSINMFNVGKFPIIESSYSIYKGTSAQTETTHYTLDLDNGDLNMLTTPANGVIIKSDHKYANWRDKNWVQAINSTIDELNARGFYRQIVRNTSLLRLSANVQVYSGPSACVDIYELLVRDNYTTSGNLVRPRVNWSYQEDQNKLVIGNKPSVANYAAISYLRNLQKYTATSATLDVPSKWEALIKIGAQAKFYRYMAGKIAKQGNANVDEGHFSFTNLRTQAADLQKEFDTLALRAKPTRPAKDMQYLDSLGGIA